jgi:ABC-type uncharacterized transport system substrate-binding protein
VLNYQKTMIRGLILLLLVLVATRPEPALAHPHLLATATVEVIFSQNGSAEGIKQTWSYDPAYSSFARKSADEDGDGKASKNELQRFAEKQLAGLKEFKYFTSVSKGGAAVEIGDAHSFSMEQRDSGQLELSFTLPFGKALIIDQPLTIELFDPNFFAYFTMDPGSTSKQPKLSNSADGTTTCATEIVGPARLDLSRTATIPSAFWSALDGVSEAGRQFVNRITVTCPSTQKPSAR